MDFAVNGLPVHVLIVHFVVVLTPLAALLGILSAVWPAARRRLGVITPLVALVSLVLVPITMAAGNWLLARLPESPLITEHANIGGTLLPWAIAVFVLTTATWLWHRRSATRSRAIGAVLAVLVAIAGVGSVVQVVLIGESGARAVWSGSYSEEPLER